MTSQPSTTVDMRWDYDGNNEAHDVGNNDADDDGNNDADDNAYKAADVDGED